MSKKTNTLLFILGGTVFNILTTLICFVILLAVYGYFLGQGQLPQSSANWALPVIFVVSIVVSFVVYRFAIKLITKKVDMEKYFDPLFGPRRPPRPKD